MNIIASPSSFLFIVSSAINATRSVFTSSERMEQTLLTLQSIREKVPNSKTIVVDASVTLLSDEDMARLQSKGVVAVIKFGSDSPVTSLSKQNRNSAGEISSLISVLGVMKTHKDLQPILNASKRIFKISGRYQLNSNFRIDYYNSMDLFGQYVFKKLPTWMDRSLSPPESLYVTRLWSMCPSLIDNFASVGPSIYESVMREGLDLEHATYKHIPHKYVSEIMPIGCSGYIATNKELVHD